MTNKKIGFRAEHENGAKAAVVVEWPLHWSEKQAIDFAAQVYVQIGKKMGETFE